VFADVQALKNKLAPGEKITDFADWLELKGCIMNERYPELFKLPRCTLCLFVACDISGSIERMVYDEHAEG
jgi:hypothetical protein